MRWKNHPAGSPVPCEQAREGAEQERQERKDSTSPDAGSGQRRGRWGQNAAASKDDVGRREDSGQGLPADVALLPFGPGSSPAVCVALEEDTNDLDSGDSVADGSSDDDEGESMMAPTAELERRKMYFRTLDDSMREQGLDDNGDTLAVEKVETLVVPLPLPLSSPWSSSRALLEVPAKQGSSTSAVAASSSLSTASLETAAATSLEASAAKQRNLRRAKQRAKARGDTVEASSGPGGCVVLIREDCRLHDNPALHFALEMHSWVIPLYVHADDDPSPWPVRGAGLWWRHASLENYDTSLQRLGSRIIYRKGKFLEQVMDVLLATGATALHFNRQLEPWHHARDLELEAVAIESLGIQVRPFTGMVMKFEPWQERKVKSADDGKHKSRREPLATVHKNLPAPPDGWPWSEALAALGYGRTVGRKMPSTFRQFNKKRQSMHEAGIKGNPQEDDWAYEMRMFWPIGEAAAIQRLEEFLKELSWGCYFPPGLHPTDEVGGRFRADKSWTARLSPYLRFGDLSPRYIDMRVKKVVPFELRELFLKRVVWRDKAYAQLYRCPDSHSVSIRKQYEHETWSGTRLQLKRWQRGETGFPLVDAAMRQLWKVGWNCNHLRHVAAQFLIEHLDLNWKDGFDWYDYTLVDTDVAINAMMWQMGGHSGIGSWNFVMHPIYAGKKIDPEGHFVRKWLPELRHLPTEYIHCPWEAPAGTCLSANVFVNGVYHNRVIEDLIAARLVHQRHVIEVRKRFPQLVKPDGNEIIKLSNGQVLNLDVRDDIRENDENNITLMMTADDPRSTKRRNLGAIKGLHSGLIYEETKRFESLYDSFDPPRRQRPSRSKDRAKERMMRRNQHGELVPAM